MSVRNAVVGIVYRKDKSDVLFLVLHRIFLWRGWEFPKGGVEKTDKTEESAVLREVREETSLENIRVITRLPYTIKYKFPKKYVRLYGPTETVQAVYLLRAFSEEVKPPKYNGVIEHDGFLWLKYEKARKTLTHVQQKRALDTAWKHLRESGQVN